MSFHSWLQNVRSALATGRGQRHDRRRGSLRATTHRPKLEVLEDRSLLSLSPATSFPVGPNSTAVVTADFNNDGNLDLATSNYDDTTGGGTVSVLLGNGDGSFQPAQTSATGQYPFSLAAGDFNADGKVDLATANYDYSEVNDVSILLGQGDGTFAAPVALNAADAYSWSIATGDLNADGKLDLVVTSDDEWLGGYVSVLLGHGDGSFAAPTTYGPYYGQLFSPALADVNGDGKVDVAVAGWHSNSVKVFLGNGNGTLRQPSDFTTGYVDVYGPDSVAAGDFNADGKLDLATTSYDGFVSMLLGNGDGTFQAGRAFAVGYGPGSATASDVNGDGKLDLVVADPGSTSPPGAVIVLLGNGDGSLTRAIATATGGSPTSVVMADFNGDGRPDAAAANTDSNNVAVLLNDGIWDGSPPPPPPPSVTIGDRAVTEGNTGTTSATFSVTLSAASSQTVTIAYATGNGTASGGSDYQAASGTLTFAPGETTKTITVPIIGDRLPEPNETFAVNLSGATNAIIADGQGVGTIRDDEPRISISDVTKKEGNGKKTTLFTFTVTLSAAYDQAVTMSFRTVNGTATTSNGDYIAKTGTLTFAPGETTKTVTIEVKGDSKRESDEAFYLDLFGLSSDALFTKSRGIGTILNDD
jgi:hypothetical protein